MFCSPYSGHIEPFPILHDTSPGSTHKASPPGKTSNKTVGEIPLASVAVRRTGSIAVVSMLRHLNAFPFKGLFGCQWFWNFVIINCSRIALNLFACSSFTLEFLKRTSVRNVIAERTSTFMFVVALCWRSKAFKCQLREKIIRASVLVLL